MTEQPRVTCVIVNWNGSDLTIKCLDALGASTYPSLNVVVVDNGSTDKSVARIRMSHPSTTLLESGANLGFARGNNIGIRHALKHGVDYVWLLNNDTEPAPEALSALVAKSLTDKRIGAVGSVCYYADDPEVVQAWAGARINLWVGFGRNTTIPRADEWFHSLYGASMLVSCDAIRDAGLLDEGFFHYWEESEFCLRLRKKGWRLAAAPGSRILHKVSGSTGRKNPILDRYFTASGLRILHLHSPFPLVSMVCFLAIRFIRRLIRFEFDRCRRVCQGIRDYLKMLPIRPRVT